MITKFKIYESKKYRTPIGMDVGLYEFFKKNMGKNCLYYVTYNHGFSGSNSAEDVEDNYWDDEKDIRENSYVGFYRRTNDCMMIDFYAYEFDVDGIFDGIKEQKEEVISKEELYNEFFEFIFELLDKYKNTPEYEIWKMSQEVNKFNL